MSIKFLSVAGNECTHEMLKKTGICNTSLLVQYYKEYNEHAFKDLSFFLLVNLEVVAYVSCYALNNKLSGSSGAVSIRLFCENKREQTSFYRAILDQLYMLAQENGCVEISIKDSLKTNKLGSLGELLFHDQYESNLTFEMLVSYDGFSEQNYHRVLRKSYKSYVNWGNKNLDLVYINSQNPCSDSFVAFQQFHQKISGHKTRSDSSWRIQYEMIRSGFGELILAYMDSQLVAGSLFIDQENVSVYFTGVYERDLFRFGLSHSLLYQGICRSYARSNSSRFTLGFFDTNIKDSKWHNIQFFKKGFSEHFVPTILWSKSV
jgi:hypothetical protein